LTAGGVELRAGVRSWWESGVMARYNYYTLRKISESNIQVSNTCTNTPCDLLGVSREEARGVVRKLGVLTPGEG